MRLKLLALLAGALVASVAVVGVAEAVVVTKATSKLTARVLPKHINPTSIKKANYTWTVRGSLTYGQYCPNGANVSPYCENVPKDLACTGKVTWYMKIGKSNAGRRREQEGRVGFRADERRSARTCSATTSRRAISSRRQS